MQVGQRLRWLGDGTDRLTWHDAWVMLSCAAPTSAVARLTEDGDRTWTVETHLLAGLVDAANLLMWAKTTDAEHNRNRPDPVPRPGDDYEGRHRKDDDSIEQMGQPVTPAALDDLFPTMQMLGM
ncbi:DUF5361 domain-containing protein [Corynebacterium variabile]|uniref:DUF5361 domain-containing protein n=1 Tax=Corynebacterium variabile TaxID=1727 RepID=UPI003FD51F3E